MADDKRWRRQEARRKKTDERYAREGRPLDVPDEVVEYQIQCEEDPEFFIEQNLSISPIEGGILVPFILNSGQREVVSVVKRELAAGKCVQIIILKSRRRGITTLCEALVYWKTSTTENITGIGLAHDKDTALEIFRIAQTFKDTDRRQKIPGLMPMIANSNERAIRFQNPNKQKRVLAPGLRSSFLVETAEGKGIGRSLTLQAVHCAEVAYYSNPGIATGLGIALTKAAGSVHIWESTANGVGNLFETTWNKAVAGENEWIPIFLPWHTDERNVLQLTAADRLKWQWIDEEEYVLATEHKIDMEHMKWRRMMLASPEMVRPGMAPEDVFRQEYPTTPEEAFVASGQNFFLPDVLKRLRHSPKGQRPPLYTGDIKRKPKVDEIDLYPPAMEFMENRFGYVSIWEMPVPGYDYAVGADVSEGLTNGDNSVAWVICRNTQNYVARIRTRALESDQFGDACACIGWFYNDALVGIEQNGPGVAANIALRRAGYHRIWYDRDLLQIDEPMRKYLGWRTSEANRRPMLDTLEAEIRNLAISIPAKEFYEEARTFLIVTTASGHAKPTAAASKRDDEIMSAAIALQLHMRGGAIRQLRTRKEDGFDMFHPTCQDPKTRRKKVDPYEF